MLQQADLFENQKSPTFQSTPVISCKKQIVFPLTEYTKIVAEENNTFITTSSGLSTSVTMLLKYINRVHKIMEKAPIQVIYIYILGVFKK